MSWSALALIATVLIGGGSIIEKLLISRYLRSHQVFLGWLAVTMLPHASVMVFLYPVPAGTEWHRVVLLLLAGACMGSSGNLMYRALSKTDASRVWPVLNVSPVFIAVFAVLLLDEHLNGWQWTFVLVAVAGTISVSLQTGTGGGVRLDRTFAILLVAAMFQAAGQLLSKYGLNEVPVLTAFWLMRFGMFIALSINLRPQAIRGMVASTRQPMGFGLILVAEILLFPFSVFLMVRALSIGPVALVSTVMATVPVWVFVLSIALSTRRWNLLNEPLDKRTLALKGVGIALIVAGIAGVSLL
ncbi:MAG: DMT family transporter [SAR202 cluster bacterium]|nr:DMT family transporter [SAR202 cluster bacterium]